MAKKQDKVKAILADLRHTFGTLGYEDQRRLWGVLSALRGPDSKDAPLKGATTTVIRGAVFGHTLDHQGFADVSYEDSDDFAATRKAMTPGHFKDHVKWAFETLGLKLTKNNGVIKPIC